MNPFIFVYNCHQSLKKNERATCTQFAEILGLLFARTHHNLSDISRPFFTAFVEFSTTTSQLSDPTIRFMFISATILLQRHTAAFDAVLVVGADIIRLSFFFFID